MALLSAGVQIREVDESEYTPQEATSVFAAVGGAEKGPMNRPTLVTNEFDFLKRFGKTRDDTYMPSAMLQFLRRGRQALVVRVGDGNEATATVNVPGLATNARLFGKRILSAGTNLAAFNLIKIAVDGASPVEINLTASVVDPTSVTLQEILDQINAALAQFVTGENIGTGNGILVTFPDTLANPNILPGSVVVTAGLVVATDDGQGNLQGLGVQSGSVDYVTGDITITYTVAPLNLVAVTADYTYDAVAFADSHSELLVLESPTTGAASSISVQATSTTTANAAPFILFGDITYPYTVNGSAAAALGAKINAASPGTWVNGYSVIISDYPERGKFQVTVVDNLDNSQAPIESLDAATWETKLNGPPALSSDIVISDSTGSRPQNGTYFLTGGTNGISTLSDADFIGTIALNGTKTGMKTLADSLSLNVNIVACPGVSSGAVVLEGIDMVKRRGDAMYIVDPPLGLDPQSVADYHNGKGAYAGLHPAFNDSFGAVYWPWVQEFDPILNKRRFTPPSGWVAAQFAYTDFISDPWFAPAGLIRGQLPTALSIEYVTDQAQRDFLQSGGNNVNPITDQGNDGIVIFGQKTLQRAPTARDRVNVRRLLSHAGKLVALKTRRVVFEPSDPTTWRRLTALINPPLQAIATNRGFEKVVVRIDASTNPPELRNQNRIGGKIFVIPTKAGEKLEFDLIILPSGAEIPAL